MVSSPDNNRIRPIRNSSPEESRELDFGSDFKPRLPSQALEAEERILGGIMLDPQALERVEDILRPEMFYLSAHQQIFKAAIALKTAHRPTDFVAIAQWLRERDLLDEVGGQSKILTLIDATVSAANIDGHAETVAEKWRRRQLFQLGQEVCMLAYDDNVPLDEAIEAIEGKLSRISGSGRAEVASLAEPVRQAFDRIERLSLQKVSPGLTCGYYDLDAMTQGFQNGDLIITAGRPSMGKTAFLLSQMLNIAMFHKRAVLLFSLEMGVEQLVNRMLASDSRIDSGRLRSGRVASQEWEPLGHSVSKLAGLPFFIDDTPGLTVGEMRSKARKLATKQDLAFIGLDYLQLMGDESSNRVQELSSITRSLKGLARELNVPVNALSQLSRSCEARTNKRPMMSDLRESGAIEQDADLIMMLYRDEYYNPDTPDRGIAEVILSKHRNGPTGTVKLLFEPQFTNFRNLARGNA